MSRAAGSAPFVVLGGGVAAQRAAFAARSAGYAGRLILVSEEAVPPYDRTALSKGLLTGAVGPDQIELCPRSRYASEGIELWLERRAELVRPGALTLSDGSVLPFERLIVCTGGRPRMLENHSRESRIHVLRDLEDAAALAQQLERCSRLLIVGGGFIAGEVASSAVARGIEVTVLEAAAAPLSDRLGPDVGAALAALYRSGGVDLRIGVEVSQLAEHNAGVVATDRQGRKHAADAALVAIGMVPDAPTLAAPLVRPRAGIVTDAYCATEIPGVYAAGDCAAWHHPRLTEHVRIEHWDTAARHGETAALNALGDAEPFDPMPFFWSEQHGVRMHAAGYLGRWDAVEVDGSQRKIVARYSWRNEPIGVFGIDSAREVVKARDELAQRIA